MSTTVVFIIGCGVLALTIYGTVMAGALAMTRREIEQNPEHAPGTNSRGEKRGFPFRMKY